jgi:YVTN family beta-propeller protein
VILLAGGAGCLPEREPTAPVEIQRPEPKSIEPAAASLVVPRTTSVTMRFDDRMDPASFTGRFVLRPLFGMPATGELRVQDTVVTFLPTLPLESGTVYEASLRGSVRDANGNTLQMNSVPVLDDTTLILSTWFYTEGDYSSGGYHRVYLRDRKEGNVRVYGTLDSLETTVGGFTAPEAMALSPDGSLLFLSNTGADRVDVVNTATNTPAGQITVPDYPSSMAVSGGSLWVICINARRLVRIDIAARTVSSNLPLTFFPGRLAVSPDGQTLYTIDQTSRDLVLLRASDGGVIKRLANAVTQIVVGELIVHPVTGDVYVCNTRGPNIRRTDGAAGSFQTLHSYGTGWEPATLVFDPAGNSEYCVAAGRSVIKYAAGSDTPVDTVSFAGSVKSLTVIPTGELLYLTSNVSVVIVDVRTLTVLEEIQLASSGIEGLLSSPQKF